MTRPATTTHAYRSLLLALSTIPAGEHVAADLFLGEAANGEWVHASRKSTREARDGGWVALYTRTGERVPDHVCRVEVSA